MTFTQAIVTCLKNKYVCVQGRASRSEYWWFALFMFMVNVIFGIVGFGISQHMGVEFNPDYGNIAMLIFLMPSIGVGVRRLHDLDKSGWWFLVFLIPFIGLIMLVWMVQKGTPGANRYGPLVV